MQKQNYVSDKWVRHLLAQEDLEVSPEDLRAQPHSATKCHERPE